MSTLQGVKTSVAEELCQMDSGNNNTVLPTASSTTSVRDDISRDLYNIKDSFCT